jgi:translocation and assembly module TamB
MQASAEADGYTITVSITGPASKPAFKFSSDPQLPEDEVIARLLFNTSLAKLSPVQLAQLAGEIDKIGGLSSGPSTLDRLKSAVGVDVLDVSTDEGDDPTVSAGSYVDENTYVGVRQGTSASSSRVVIDHDLTKTLKARGELGADGNSKIGIGVEWDY